MPTNSAGRNKRTVWTIATRSFPGAHFATFPPKLIEPCILAGTSERGCCAECGAPWERVVDRKLVNTKGWGGAKKDHHAGIHGQDAIARNKQGRAGDSETTTTGWQPTCACNADTTPCTVLDPFFGSGTTGLVAHQYDRKFVGIELSEEYCNMAAKRIEQETQQLKLW